MVDASSIRDVYYLNLTLHFKDSRSSDEAVKYVGF